MNVSINRNIVYILNYPLVLLINNTTPQGVGTSNAYCGEMNLNWFIGSDADAPRHLVTELTISLNIVFRVAFIY